MVAVGWEVGLEDIAQRPQGGRWRWGTEKKGQKDLAELLEMWGVLIKVMVAKFYIKVK